MTTAVARHRTAMSRSALSRPLVTALGDQLLGPGVTVFDYGCGRGDDVRNLESLGYDVDGWDPSHRPQADRRPADVVNLGYVINVIERVDERAQALRSAWDLARQVLIVSSRLTWDARDLVGRPLADGLVTKTGTFQKFYEQAELATWIEQTLNVQPHAAAPGVFYVFRDSARAQQFLANRVYRYRPRVSIDPHATYEQHRERLAPVLAFLSDHARPPRPGELPTDQELAIQDSLGSLGRAIRLIRQVTDDAYWQRVTNQRRAELLIYIALSRFGRRPRFSQLGTTLAGDIRALFGTYQSACVQADRLLLACGDPAMIFVTARSSPIGKQTPTALYVHRSALAELPPVLQVYEGCARALTGTVDGANLIKLSVTQPQVSYLAYPRFDRDPHPTLAAAVTVNLRKLTVDWRDYTRSDNPPLLHRKEEFIGTDDPRRALYSRLTRAEQRAGLYEHPERIGTLRGWQATMAGAHVELRGHRLVRRPAEEG
ncbi:DNA phosphorothioation-associated putative methyltransferase [Micromonospora sp. NPDC050686]|uniref:DNA phosphorothioation-associated putative methyltransferase n=1 Tax=Micromonospora sp. NPDC050686 TaxID=3154631 RepID=UPI0033D243E6